MTAYRNNTLCPRCKRQEAVFAASAGNGLAWYRCMNLLRADACGYRFVLPHPKPLNSFKVLKLSEAA